jgi:streptogramin lyase
MIRRTVNRSFALVIAAGALLAATAMVRADEPRGVVRGTVSDRSGQPVDGAFVRLKNAERRLTFLVISREQGKFEAADLPPGAYTAQGVGGDFQSNLSSAVNVVAGQSAAIDLALSNARGPLLPAAWPHKVPEAQIPGIKLELPEGDAKALVQEKCTVCHTVQRIMVQRAGLDDWNHSLAAMRSRLAVANMPDLTDAEATRIATYLATHFKPVQPYDPNSRLPTTLQQGPARNYRVVMYDLVDHYSEPHDVAVDPRGIAWVGERLGNKIGRFDPRTLEFSEVEMPPGPALPGRQSLGNPQIDANGILWVNDGPNARWLSYDTKTGKFLAFAWPKGHGSAGGNSMALHPDGTIWATGGNKEVRMLNPATAEFKFFEAPSAKTGKLPGSYGLAVAGDGSVWWAEPLSDLMARADPATGKVEEFKIPDQGRSYPRRMNNDGNGDLWVANWMSGKLMKIDHKTRQMRLYAPPGDNAGHYSVVVDKPRHLVWASEHQVDKIARFDPGTESWIEFPMPEAESDLRRIEIDPTDSNRIFFAGNSSGRVGFMELVP